jgi:hypothetical protein
MDTTPFGVDNPVQRCFEGAFRHLLGIHLGWEVSFYKGQYRRIPMVLTFSFEDLSNF